MDRDGLADFLRRRREALQPADLGLPPRARRRTPGLRREEVAALAHMSTDFYERLEQRRGSRPSEQTVAALGRALRLTPDERGHLFELARHTARPRAFRTDRASPGLLRVLGRLDTPAQIVSDLGVTLAQNPLAETLVGVQTRYTGLQRSIIYRWFTDPAQRRIHPAEPDPRPHPGTRQLAQPGRDLLLRHARSSPPTTSPTSTRSKRNYSRSAAATSRSPPHSSGNSPAPTSTASPSDSTQLPPTPPDPDTSANF